jgi:DNA-binding MarR family transcriptional regulator
MRKNKEARIKDPVDDILTAWRAVRPDLDLKAMGIIGRFGRSAGYIQKAVESELQKFGLAIADFDVLASLRRAGPPYRLTPTQLYRNLMITSGTMTNRLDKLEERGLVTRHDDPNDRRGIQVSLTPKGLTLADSAVTAHVTNEAGILSGLTASEQSTLDGLLRKLLGSLASGTPAETSAAGLSASAPPRRRKPSSRAKR